MRRTGFKVEETTRNLHNLPALGKLTSEDILNHYSNVFKPGRGKPLGSPMHINLDPSVTPVHAITGMPTPVDKAAVQRFLGMCQYLSKFCQNLSQTVLPLRDLTGDDTEFLWSDVHETAFNSDKNLIASTTALRYYDVSLPVTLQVDASESAIGGV